MKSFIDLGRTFANQPAPLGVRLARVDVGRGREELYRDQLPELLQSLAEQTRVASITASSAIEGVVVDSGRLPGLVQEGAQPARFRNRNEREFAGYRDAMDEIVRATTLEPVSVPYILHLHRLLFGYTDGGGGRLKTEQNLIASYEHGHREILFTPPSPKETEYMLPELVTRYLNAAETEAAHPLILIAAFVLDFLAIHPVADGNGRLARLLTTHLLLQESYGVARYTSIEQRIYDSKNAYYGALLESQRNWHDASHTIWPWTAYLTGVMADAYDDFETRVSTRRRLSSMSKQDRVRAYVLEHGPEVFRMRDIRLALPGVSDQTIRLALGDLKRRGLIDADHLGGTGRNAAWRRSISSSKSEAVE
jgi:Fic family protein